MSEGSGCPALPPIGPHRPEFVNHADFCPDIRLVFGKCLRKQPHELIFPACPGTCLSGYCSGRLSKLFEMSMCVRGCTSFTASPSERGESVLLICQGVIFSTSIASKPAQCVAVACADPASMAFDVAWVFWSILGFGYGDGGTRVATQGSLLIRALQAAPLLQHELFASATATQSRRFGNRSGALNGVSGFERDLRMLQVCRLDDARDADAHCDHIGLYQEPASKDDEDGDLCVHIGRRASSEHESQHQNQARLKSFEQRQSAATTEKRNSGKSRCAAGQGTRCLRHLLADGELDHHICPASASLVSLRFATARVAWLASRSTTA